MVLAEVSSISESSPNPSSATDPATTAVTIATPASTVIHPMLSTESIRARRMSLKRVVPSGRMMVSEGVCALTTDTLPPQRARCSQSKTSILAQWGSIGIRLFLAA